MNTLEIILLVGGIILLIAGMVVLFRMTSFFSFFLFIIAMLMIGFSVDLFNGATRTTETNEILMTVKNKNKETCFVGVPGKGGHSQTDYYLILDNNKKIKVSKTVYNKYNNNDTILCFEKTTYKIDRDTKKKLNMLKVEYSIKN